MTSFSIAILTLAWTLGSFVNTLTGMGGAIVALPIAALALPPRLLIPASCLGGAALSLYVAWLYFRSADLGEMFWLVVGNLPGSALGGAFLRYAPLETLELGIGVLLLAFVAWQAWGGKVANVSLPFSRGGALLVGLLAGFAQTGVGIGGPPIAIYGTLRRWDKDLARGMFSLFFALGALSTVVSQFFNGLYTPEVVYAAFWVLPGLLFGALAARPLIHRIRQHTFQRILLVLIACSGFLLLGRAL